MKSGVEENIDALSRVILAEAQAEADHVLTEAREKADAIRKRSQEQAEAERQKILARAREEAERLRGQTIATTQLKARTMQLEHREKMLDKVFTTAQQELATIQQWTDYPEIAQDLLREAILQLGSKQLIVRADPKTQSILSRSLIEDLAREYNVEIQVGQPLETGIGVIVETVNGHLQFDNTLETRLRRMQNNLRAPIYHLLMGEAV